MGLRFDILQLVVGLWGLMLAMMAYSIVPFQNVSVTLTLSKCFESSVSSKNYSSMTACIVSVTFWLHQYLLE